jgi:hypothetical protein
MEANLTRIFAAVLVAAAMVAPSQAAESEVRAWVAGNGHVSVAARAQPLSRVLQEIGRVTGVAMQFEPSAELRARLRTITTDIKDVPLETAVRMLLRGEPATFRRSADGRLIAIQVGGQPIPIDQVPPPPGPSPVDGTATRPWGGAPSTSPLEPAESSRTGSRALSTATVASTAAPANIAVAVVAPESSRVAVTTVPPVPRSKSRTLDDARERLREIRRGR